MPMWAAAGGAVLGGIMGAKKKPDRQVSEFERMAQSNAQASLGAYSGLVGAGANQTDVAAGAQGQRDLAALLQQYQSQGMYDLQAGRSLAEQQYAPQRQLLQQNFQDQLAQANQAAALAGRSGNDPILRARLAQDQNRQSLQLGAQQAQAGLAFGREAVTDRLNLAGQRSSTLANLAQQAFTNQGNLFNMSQNALQSERAYSFQNAGFQAGRGGGFMGALTGAVNGASAGVSLAGGIGAATKNLTQAAAQTTTNLTTPGPAPGYDTSGIGAGGGSFASWGAGPGGAYQSPVTLSPARAPAAMPAYQPAGPGPMGFGSYGGGAMGFGAYTPAPAPGFNFSQAFVGK